MTMEDLTSSSPKFSYSTTGASKNNVLLDQRLRAQHDKNLKVWESYVNHPIKEHGIMPSNEIYYNEELDTLMIANEYLHTPEDKALRGIGDYLWMTIIHRPEFCLAPTCRVEKKCFSLEATNFGELLEERPVREVYDLEFFIKFEHFVI